MILSTMKRGGWKCVSAVYFELKVMELIYQEIFFWQARIGIYILMCEKVFRLLLLD